MRVLFIDGPAQSLAPTAAQVFDAYTGISTDFAGIDHDTAETLSTEQIDWADVIFAMERRHVVRLSERFGRHVAGKKVLVLDIREGYTFMEPRLIDLLIARAGPRLD